MRANGDKFVAGGYDLTADNLAAIKDGHAYVTLGQSAFVQGYLPVALLVNAIKAEEAARRRLLQCRHADGDRRQRRHGATACRRSPSTQAQALAADPAATAAYYKPWTATADGGHAERRHAAASPPSPSERQTGICYQGRPIRSPLFIAHDCAPRRSSPSATSPSATAAWWRSPT